MFAYHKFLIKDTDRFDAAAFPRLNDSLRQTLEQLTALPAGPSTAMIVSYVKHHSINSQLVKDHPQLASQISSKELPLSVMEQLFESSRKNPSFQSDLEDYVVAYLTTGKMNQPGS